MTTQQREYARDARGRTHVLADADGDVTVTLCGRRLIDFEDLTPHQQMLAEALTLPLLCAMCVSIEVEQ